MASKLNVQVIVGLVDRLSGPLKGLQGKVKAAGREMQKTGMAMAGVGAGIAAAFAPAISAFAEIEDATTRLEVAMMRKGGVVPESFKDLEALANTLGDRLPGTTADFTRMLTMLQRQGMTTSTILGGTGEAAANLAVMLKMTPEAAAEFTAKLQDATSVSEKHMLALADTIQRTFYLGVDPNNMLGAYSRLAPAMATIKQQGLAGAQAMAPLIAMLDQAGLSGDSAGNALRKVFTRSFAQGKDAPGAMRQSGMSLVDKRGEFKGLDNMLKELQKLRKFSTETRVQILGDIWGDDAETLQALNTMIEKGSAGYAQMSAKMADQATLQERMNKLLGTLLNLWDAASGTFTNLQAAIGELLKPEIQALVTWFGEISAAVKKWIEDNPELARTITLVAVALGGLTLAMGFLGVAVGLVTVALAPVLTPIALVGIAIAALTAGFLYYRKAGVEAVVNGIIWIEEKFDGLIRYFDGFGTMLYNVGAALIDGLWRGISEKFAAIKAKISGIADSITGIFRSETETHSPSRVFAALGADLMRGLEVGINATSRLPMAAMRSAAGAVALGASVTAMPSAAALGGPGGASISMPITIHITAPAGTDAQGLAELVRQAVNQSTRQAASRLGSLYDSTDGL